MYHSIRLSRLTHPRASLVATVLLVVVLGLFGLFANALVPEPHAAAPNTVEGTALIVHDWILGRQMQTTNR